MEYRPVLVQQPPPPNAFAPGPYPAYPVNAQYAPYPPPQAQPYPQPTQAWPIGSPVPPGAPTNLAPAPAPAPAAPAPAAAPAAARRINKAQPDAQGLINRSDVLRKDLHLWYNQGFLIPHEAIRAWMEDMEVYVSGNDSFDPIKYPWKAENYFKFFNDYFYPFVHKHHDEEEHVITPWFKSKGLTFPDKIMKDHVQLLEGLGELKNMEVQYRAILRAGGAERDGKIRDWVEKLKDKILEVNEHMRGHLAEEETLYPPVMRDKLTQKEWQECEKKIIKSIGMKESKLMFPHVFKTVGDWGGAPMTQQLLQSIPGPVVYLLNNYWTPPYKSYTSKLLPSLVLDTDPMLKMPPSGCCVVM